MKIRKKLAALLSVVGLVVLLAACAPAVPSAPAAQSATDAAAPEAAPAGPVEVRVGYQRGGASWNLLKSQAALEARFGTDVTVTWTLFTAGPPMMEALNAGAIDIGSVGETPPIFAQAAGAPLVYVAQQSNSGAGSGIVVLPDSPIQTLADLKGKKVAFTKAYSADLLTIRALEKAGLTYGDIEPALLQPPEGRAALEGGSVDAWVIWNPFFEAAIQELGARVVIDGSEVSPTTSFIIAARPFVEQQPDKVAAIIEELQKVEAWAGEHLEEYGALLEKETELPAAVWIGAYQKDAPKLLYLDDTVVENQQKVADIFYELELIPAPLKISEVVWFGE